MLFGKSLSVVMSYLCARARGVLASYALPIRACARNHDYVKNVTIRAGIPPTSGHPDNPTKTSYP